MDQSITQIVDSFVASIVAHVEEGAAERAREAVLAAFGAPVKRGPGRPPALASSPSFALSAPTKTRKKPPRQLCPVPGCKNTAAPVFGMVCKDHKDVPKAQIKKFRKERKALKTD